MKPTAHQKNDAPNVSGIAMFMNIGVVEPGEKSIVEFTAITRDQEDTVRNIAT